MPNRNRAELFAKGGIPVPGHAAGHFRPIPDLGRSTAWCRVLAICPCFSHSRKMKTMAAQVECLETSEADCPEPIPAISPQDWLFGDVAELSDEVEIPHAWWLTRLQLDRPRHDIRSLDPWTRRGKRFLDLTVSLLLLVLLAPVMLLVALAVRLSSPGPVIYRQTRVGLNLRRRGRDRRRQRPATSWTFGERRQYSSDRRQEFAYGRHFTIYKFRTMRIDAEKDGAQLARIGDGRATPLGRVLRKTRLDELPQLWNVLKGEMSLVGPRPERPEFMAQLSEQIPNYLDRLGLKPGLTGVAQIVNGYDNEIEGFRRKVAFDLHYLQNCSVWNDVKILIRTIGVVLTGSGAV